MGRGCLHAGTSSWSEKSWVGPFYPKGTQPGDFLRHYATVYDCVEADVTYYRVPDSRLVDGWVEKTPDNFRLCAKFPKTIVHCGRAAAPDGDRVLVPEHTAVDTGRFLEAMARLGERCGPLVLQFPYFNKRAFASKDPFLDRLDAFLDALPSEFRYAVEIRNKNWVGEDLLQVLREHSVALCLVDLVYMPHPARLADELNLVTTNFIYGRLIGDRKAVDAKTDTFDEIVLDQSDRLKRWARLLDKMLEQVPDAWIFANNHYAGHGPSTIDELVENVEMLDA
ncbi:MAG: DUF72 domain-containing protein [Planctomycetota bacterium]